MRTVGERAVARDTGGRGALPLHASSATAAQVQPAPGTKHSAAALEAVSVSGSKPGRPFVLTSLVPPALPAPWYRTARPCGYCRAAVLRRVERGPEVFLRVSHESGCVAR